MTDPIKLAKEIASDDDPDCAETAFLLFERHRKLVAAALRLAEATRTWERTPQAGIGSTEKRSAWAGLVRALDAYRKARDGAK